jgi:hypothetical protein
MDSKLKKLYQQFSANSRNSLSPASKQRIKDRIFQRLAEPVAVAAEPAVSWWSRFRHSMILKSYVLVPLVILLFIVTTTAASAQSLPGDVLYPVKRQVESARILLAPTPEAKLELELNFAEKRLEELEKLQATASVSVSQDDKTANIQANAAVNDNANKDKDENKNSSDDNDKQAREDRDHSSNDRQAKARQQAEGALEFLEKTKEQYKGHPENQRSQDLDKRIENYRSRLFQNRDGESGRDGSGKVKGSTDVKIRLNLPTDRHQN